MTHIDMEKFRMEFLEEATDLLENANESILKAESEGDTELFNAVFRNIHTIKGSAGGFGFDNMSDFSHHLESLLDKLRNGQLTIDGDITDLLLKGVDVLFEMIEYARDKKEYDRDLTGILAMFSAADGATAPAAEQKPAEASTLARADRSISSILKQNNPGFGKAYKIDLNFTDDMLENGYDPVTLLSNLKEISEFYFADTDTSSINVLSSHEPYKLHLRPKVYIISDAAKEEIADLAFDPELMNITEISLEDEPGEKTETFIPETMQSSDDDEYEQIPDTVDTEGIQNDLLAELASGIEDYFESIENFLITIEKTGEGSKDALDNIFRVFHNIKGDCGYVGFKFLEKYAHLVENMLDKVRSGSIVFDKKAAEFILNVISDVKALMKSILINNAPEMPRTYKQLSNLQESMLTMEEKTPAVTGDIKVFLSQVDQFLEIISLAKANNNNHGMLKRAGAGLANAAKYIGFADLNDLAQKFGQKAGAGADFSTELENIEKYIAALKSPAKKLGELLIESGKVTPKEIEEAKAQQKKIGEILVDQGKLNKQDLEIALKKQVIMKAVSPDDTSNISLASALTKEEQEEKDGASKEKYSQSMKVDQEKIDKFTNTIGELVVAKNAYEYMVQKLIREFDLPTSLLKDFKDNSNLISRIAQDLQRDIMSLRMVPIKQIFNKFPRVVRDIARKQNKQIDLRIIGEDTEIDKKIADILSDPLVHLVRNSCDHGIETPPERSAASKPEEGHLILKAYNEGSFVYIEVIDDGRGIDPKKILAKAINKGLAPEDAVMPDNEIIQFILAPGFSTAETVTDISGRGVGMDVVKSSITSVGGNIDVQSSVGDGTRMIMKIPVTIGMSTSLLVRMEHDEHYAFPIENVAETIKVDRKQVKDLHFGNGIYYRGNVLPLVHLSKLLGESEKELPEEVNIVITVTDNGKTGIIVDELLNRMDIAIKPVPEYFAHLNYIGGVTILGDGKAVLVLNVNKLL